jgi:hypothetical protein
VSVERGPARRRLPHALNVGADAAAVKAAGYDADTIVLAELAPQIEIAWADGRMSSRERETILDAATHRDVQPHSRSHSLLVRWLERRPPDHFFRISRDVIQQMFRRLPGELKAHVRRSLLRECHAVAGASGGFLGWRSVSTDEQHVIDSFASDLDWGESDTGCSENRSQSTLAVSADQTMPARCDSAGEPPAR